RKRRKERSIRNTRSEDAQSARRRWEEYRRDQPRFGKDLPDDDEPEREAHGPDGADGARPHHAGLQAGVGPPPSARKAALSSMPMMQSQTSWAYINATLSDCCARIRL